MKFSLARFLIEGMLSLTFKIFIMGNLLYLIAVILVIIWAISFLGGFYTGGIIHILLVIAVIMIILKAVNRGTV